MTSTVLNLVLPTILAPFIAAGPIYLIARALFAFAPPGPQLTQRIRRVVGFLIVLTAIPTVSNLLHGVSETTLTAASGPATVASIALMANTLVNRRWPKPSGMIRVARLTRPQPTTPGNLRLLRGLLVLALCIVAALLVAGLVFATSDGRAIAIDSRASAGRLRVEPWPGLSYAAQIATAIALMLAIARWAWRTVDTRARLGGPGSTADRFFRVDSRRRILRTCALGALMTAAPLALITGVALSNLAIELRIHESPLALQPPWDWRQDLGFAITGVAALCTLLAFVALSHRRTQLPAPDPVDTPSAATP